MRKYHNFSYFHLSRGAAGMFCMPASSVLRVYLGRSMLHLELGIVTAASNPFAMKWTALDNFKWVQNPANTDLFTTSHALHEELKSPDCSLLPPPNIYGSGNCSFRPQVFSPRYLLDNLRELAYMSSFWRKIGIFFKRFRREPLVGFVGMLPPPPLGFWRKIGSFLSPSGEPLVGFVGMLTPAPQEILQI